MIGNVLAYIHALEREREHISTLCTTLVIKGSTFFSSTLPQLVSFILTSYKSQPVDFLMHYFDVLQLADKFKEGTKVKHKIPVISS